MQIILIDLINR